MDDQTSVSEIFVYKSETCQESSSSDVETIAASIDTSSICSEDDCTKLGHKLVEWAQTCKVKASAVDKLLPILHSRHSQLPVTYKSLLNREQNGYGSLKCQPVTITSGEYIHFSILEGLLSCANSFVLQNGSNVKYQVNVDGLPLFKSYLPIMGHSSCGPL